MTTSSNLGPDAPADKPLVAPGVLRATRPLYWSVRRELWENKSIYVAPLAAAAVLLFGFLISTMTLPRRMTAVLALDPGRQRATVTMPYNVIAGLVFLTAFVVAVFYCLDALHGERRDRSILFWKSLPVSDLTTVISKASIPLVVLPLVVLAIVLTAHLFVLVFSTLVLLGNGPGLAALWTHVKFAQMSVALFYCLTAISLWHAPLYGWLLLVSAWARRSAFLWAVLPPLAIAVFERIAFQSAHFGNWLKYRLIGWFTQAFIPHVKGEAPVDPLAALTPGRFLITPGLWAGLFFAALFLAAAVRVRRNREPI
jgi:ABC-2 type transport system permease protein